MAHTRINPTDVSAPVAAYSHAIVTAPQKRWLFTAGEVGIDIQGVCPPSAAEQAEIIWQNITRILRDANMTAHDIVRVTGYLLDRADFPAYAAARTKVLGEARPASTVLYVAGLNKPEWRLEVEIIAAAD
jgi:2-iminobutanoate/2-iminopropanoate deaminase